MLETRDVNNYELKSMLIYQFKNHNFLDNYATLSLSCPIEQKSKSVYNTV